MARPEAGQLAVGMDVLGSAREVLADPLSPDAEVRYAAIRLSGAWPTS